MASGIGMDGCQEKSESIGLLVFRPCATLLSWFLSLQRSRSRSIFRELHAAKRPCCSHFVTVMSPCKEAWQTKSQNRSIDCTVVVFCLLSMCTVTSSCKELWSNPWALFQKQMWCNICSRRHRWCQRQVKENIFWCAYRCSVSIQLRVVATGCVLLQRDGAADPFHRWPTVTVF